MKTLYLIRHAKSDWENPALDDFERPLNKRGEKNAPFMGEILAKHQIHPDLILCSPALRAKTTALKIAEKVGYKGKKIDYRESLYLADIRAIEALLQSLCTSDNTVFIVGHNPGLTLFAEYISGILIENIPTCGIFCVTLKKDDWSTLGRDSADFVSFEYPKMYT
ncbi:MAG: histidine phosphatase family protein [Sulfuricurvum sp.]|jgi:phosphohistidine phosphatase|uniref:SixA phosphatase family protein n=1 Tax=Sulfuricurvum sp. TaxID=2025608 RepID=UPI0025F28041|nr:histidine phosphatase family protein [Sulfuricurvum sp.]MCK9374356.1 histidine phosphatase family protein [Sulfuricurvum sp.]